MNSKNPILVIPDVHGRTFWKEAVNEYPDLDIIFLGDYLDPYEYEGISKHQAIENFNEIIDFARNHNNCQLLLGNHDAHYFLDVEGSRKDDINAPYIKNLILSNKDLFAFLTIRVKNARSYLLSHAPVLVEWVNEVKLPKDIEGLVNLLNSSLKDLKRYGISLQRILNHISYYRGGVDNCGSPIWCDVRELEKGTFLPGIDYNIFGHTQLSNPIIRDTYACLDTRNAYIITEKRKIEPVIRLEKI